MISVVMSVYNGERYLREAIDSVLGQTFRDFEFVIVDDASSDATGDILAQYRDVRIRVHRNRQNLGLTRSLNAAFARCAAKYIARMDADDVSAPRRFERQLQLLESHPEVGVCATRTRVLDAARARAPRAPTDDARIAAELLFGNCIAHPSVMLRRQVLVDHGMAYDEQMRRSQDYELWTRLSGLTRFAVVPEPLLYYRKHARSVSSTEADAQRAARTGVALRDLQRIGTELAPSVLNLHRDYMEQDYARLREPEAFMVWARGLLSLPGRSHLQSDPLVRALSLRVLDVFRWPSAMRARVAAQLIGAAAGTARLETLARYGLVAAWLPGPVLGYLRYG
jgi:glycosyltransferase involved in cell wall biosynthesis